MTFTLCLSSWWGYSPNGAQPQYIENCINGKAQPFRTSSGTAAGSLQIERQKPREVYHQRNICHGALPEKPWLPLVPTPNHPEYPAAHGAVSTAYAEALRHFFGTKKVTITLTSTLTGTAHTFHTTDEVIKEIIVARIYGGMHYRTSGVHGSVMGRKVAQWVANHYFQPAVQ